MLLDGDHLYVSDFSFSRSFLKEAKKALAADEPTPTHCEEQTQGLEENLLKGVLLKTACGSPTYAAPELVLSSKA